MVNAAKTAFNRSDQSGPLGNNGNVRDKKSANPRQSGENDGEQKPKGVGYDSSQQLSGII